MMRGTIQNKRVEISQEDAQQYLKLGKVAHVATVDEEGFPYVIPFVYVYEGRTNYTCILVIFEKVTFGQISNKILKFV